MSDSPAIFLHAELLPNIRQLTLHVSLPNSPSDVDIRESTITLSESRRAITVFTNYHGKDDTRHELVETLKLPVTVTDASRRNLSFAGHRVDNTSGDAQSAKTAEYSFRLQVDDHDTASRSSTPGPQTDGYVPWTANDMPTCAGLYCKFCKQLIIDTSTSEIGAWQWKDLPSANWAEMMDFWHCHKPDVHVDEKEQQKAIEEQTASTKGYGASNRVIATPRTVLVDVASFLVAESDCRNNINMPTLGPTKSTLLKESKVKAKTIECSECSAILGMSDPAAEGLRIYKNNIFARHVALQRAEPLYQTYAVDVITSAQLLDLIDHEGVRRFVIHAGQQDGILLWVFNPDLRYSNSSSDHSIVSRRAMKVLYQNVIDAEGILEPDNGAPAPLSLEELFLPENIYDELTQSLERSNSLLPDSARVFREWNVALLDRL